MIILFICACYVTFTIITNLTAKDIIFWFQHMQ